MDLGLDVAELLLELLGLAGDRLELVALLGEGGTLLVGLRHLEVRRVARLGLALDVEDEDEAALAELGDRRKRVGGAGRTTTEQSANFVDVIDDVAKIQHARAVYPSARAGASRPLRARIRPTR